MKRFDDPVAVAGEFVARDVTAWYIDEDFDERVTGASAVAVVDFWAPWCDPCKLLEPILVNLAGRYQVRPDGDTPVSRSLDDFRVPDCPECGGVLKPGVVFFGESVPRPRVEAVEKALGEADALLVVGSSLMVWSGYRFVRAARERELPVAAVNLGRTRADEELTLKITDDCSAALPAAVA